jgi:hypothetical protein
MIAMNHLTLWGWLCWVIAAVTLLVAVWLDKKFPR